MCVCVCFFFLLLLLWKLWCARAATDLHAGGARRQSSFIFDAGVAWTEITVEMPFKEIFSETPTARQGRRHSGKTRQDKAKRLVGLVIIENLSTMVILMVYT